MHSKEKESLSARLYRRAQRVLLPGDLYAEYGEEMRDVFLEHLARVRVLHGAARAAWLWVDELRQMSALRMRIPRVRRPVASIRFLPRELVHGMRLLWSHKTYAATAIATLALGIGANAAIFSVVHAVLLKPLPYPDPDELVVVWCESREDRRARLSGPVATSLAEAVPAFAAVGHVMGTVSAPFDVGDGAEEILSTSVSTDILSVYAVKPLLGRGFVREDQHTLSSSLMRDPEVRRPTGAMVLTHGYWRRRFGEDASVVGRVFSFDGHPRRVVGVMPPGFELHLPARVSGGSRPDAFHISYWDQSSFPVDGSFITVVARVRRGASFAEARGQLDTFAADLRSRYPELGEAGYRLRMEPLDGEVSSEARAPVLLLFGAVALLLLIACVNVANLSLAQAVAREREWAVRAAMGAGGGRLLRQSIVESIVLSTMGAISGLGVAALLIPAIVRLAPESLPRVETVGIDAAVLSFTLIVAILTAAVFGLVPALRASRVAPASVLRARHTSPPASSMRFLLSLVAAEMAVTFVLVTGMALLVRSFHSLTLVDPGFETEGVTLAYVSPTTSRYPTPSSRMEFYRDLQETMAAIPGVEAVGLAVPMPFDGLGTDSVSVLQPDGSLRTMEVALRRTLPGFEAAFGLPLQAGRFLEWRDFTDMNRLYAVIDERFAEGAWPGEDPIGRRIRVERREYGGEREVWMEPYWAEVVGVAANIRSDALSSDDPESVYVSFHQNPWGGASIAVKTVDPEIEVAPAMRESLRSLDPGLPLTGVHRLEDDLKSSLAELELALSLIGAFGTLSLVLAFVGIAGVITFSVQARTKEIGVRIALGAEPARVLGLVLGRGLRVSVIGLAIGAPIALASTRFLEGYLYGVTPEDPLTLTVVALGLVGVAFAACAWPARRATRVDPIRALRTDG